MGTKTLSEITSFSIEIQPVDLDELRQRIEHRHWRELATAAAGRLRRHLCLGIGGRDSLGWHDVDGHPVARRGQVDADKAVDSGILLRSGGAGMPIIAETSTLDGHVFGTVKDEPARAAERAGADGDAE